MTIDPTRPFWHNRNCLAKGKVRYVENRIVAVAATSKRIAKAVRLISVTYEDLEVLHLAGQIHKAQIDEFVPTVCYQLENDI